MRVAFTIIIIILLCNVIMAQNTSIGLSIGDSLPDFSVPKVIGSKKQINTAAYKNQLLIIDFWNTGCKTCVESLPKMENLEEKFQGKVKILPVTSEKEERINEFFRNNKYTRNLKGPSVVEDKIFHAYFKHLYIPHEIWILRGKIIGITSLEYVDERTITGVLKGDSIDWPLKNDFYTFDSSKNLFQVNSKQMVNGPNLLEYAAISDFRAKVNSPIWFTGGSGIIRDTLNKTIRSYFLNQPVLNSYIKCFSKTGKHTALIKPAYNGVQPNQILWEVTDKSKYAYEQQDGVYPQNWLLKNGICFESVYRDNGQSDRQVYESIIADLDRLLGLNVRWEKRLQEVLVLKKSVNTTLITNKKDVLSHENYYDIHSICFYLNEESDNPYVFNESGDEVTEVLINSDSWSNIPSVNKSLNSFGFELKTEYREVDKLIFSEINGGKVVSFEMQKEAMLRKRQNPGCKVLKADDNEAFLDSNTNNRGVQQLRSGLQYKVLRKGTGSTPLNESRVLINYEGRLINGKIFESSYETGLSKTVAIDKLVSGFQEALQLMSEGAEWEIYIPAKLGYGSHTGNGAVPPNSTLIFRVELLKILK